MGLPEKAIAYLEMADYLVLEDASLHKHEYMDGIIYAIQGEPVRGMAGGSAVHADIIRNIGFALHQRLKGSPCSVKMTEMRLRIDAADSVFYPDVLVHCQAISNPAITMELTQARLVVEVLSPTTQHFDRGSKLAAYKQLVGLEHIILLSSMEEAGWTCQRLQGEAVWSELTPWQRGTPLPLAGLGLEVGWDEVYAGVGLS